MLFAVTAPGVLLSL